MYRTSFHVLFVCCLVFLIPTYHAHAFISMVSVDENGVPGGGRSVHSSITPDGRFVVFSSFAENLIPEGNSDRGNVFVFDRQTGVREMVSTRDTKILFWLHGIFHKQLDGIKPHQDKLTSLWDVS